MTVPQLPAGRWAAEPQGKEGTGLPWVCAFNLGRPASLCDFNKGEGLSWLHQNHSSTRKEVLGEEGTHVPEPSYTSLPPCQTWTQTFQLPWHNVLRMLWCYRYFLSLPVVQLDKMYAFPTLCSKCILKLQETSPNRKRKISTLSKFDHVQILYILYHLVCFSSLNNLWLFFINLNKIIPSQPAFFHPEESWNFTLVILCRHLFHAVLFFRPSVKTLSMLIHLLLPTTL